MTEGQSPDQVPEWVTEFITSRKKQKREQLRRDRNEGNPPTNEKSYLLCPFDKAQVKGIKIGLDKAKEEATARMSGPLMPGRFGMDPAMDKLMAEKFLTDFVLIPLGEREMREALVKYTKWPRWEDDPWKTYGDFLKWLSSAEEDARNVWAINETYSGRIYFLYMIFKALEQVNFTEMTNEELLAQIGPGAENFLWVKSYTGWDEFIYHYLTRPLPSNLINDRIVGYLKSYPLYWYKVFVSSICLWKFAMPELHRREKEHPEVDRFLSYVTATDEELSKITKALSPQGAEQIDREDAWRSFESTRNIKSILYRFQNKYADVFDAQSYLDGRTLHESFVEAQAGLFDAVSQLKKNPTSAVVEGLKGNLPKLLYSIVHNDLEDLRGKYERQRPDEVRTESDLDAERDRVGSNTDTPFPDTLAGDDILDNQSSFELTHDLEAYGLNLATLTPTEWRVLCDVGQGLDEGYDFASKQGRSFKQKWGEDYDRNIKAFNRARTKLRRT